MPEVFRSVRKLNPQQVDIEIDLGIFKYGEYFVETHGMMPIAECNNVLQRSVITLWANNADLICVFYEPLDDPGAHRGPGT